MDTLPDKMRLIRRCLLFRHMLCNPFIGLLTKPDKLQEVGAVAPTIDRAKTEADIDNTTSCRQSRQVVIKYDKSTEHRPRHANLQKQSGPTLEITPTSKGFELLTCRKVTSNKGMTASD